MISVIVCSYNRSESLKKTLNSLATLRTPFGEAWEMIVVDNNSIDDTAKVVKAFAATSHFIVRYLFEPNQGLSHARNAGIRAAKGEIVAFTDDDVTVDPCWLRELLTVFDQFRCVGVGGRILVSWDHQKPSWLETEGPHAIRSGALVSFDLGDKPRELTCSPFGANMAFRKTVFENYGFFRTDLGRRGNNLMIGEDSEFCDRLLRAGQKLAYAPAALVYHPIPRERLDKAHFQAHYFNYGNYVARLEGFRDNAKLWFGVPRYLFRSLLTYVCKWLFTFDSKGRFRSKLDVCECLGQISGSYINRSYITLGEAGQETLTKHFPKA